MQGNLIATDAHAAGSTVPQSSGASDIGADQVALHQVPRRARAADLNALAVVAGDDIPGAGRRPPNRVVRRYNGHANAVAPISGASDIGADEVPFDNDASTTKH